MEDSTGKLLNSINSHAEILNKHSKILNHLTELLSGSSAEEQQEYVDVEAILMQLNESVQGLEKDVRRLETQYAKSVPSLVAQQLEDLDDI